MQIRKLLVVTAVAITAMLPWATRAQQLPDLPIDDQVRIGKLDNGLTYYIRHNEWPKERVNFYIAQRVGSMQEEENQRGLAHFLEHMAFNGTRHFPGNSLIKYLESIGIKFGAQLNAYTGFDETVYNINEVSTASRGSIDSCLLILSDWADGLTLPGEEIEKERGVIKEEWRMSSTAQMRIYERQLPKLYPDSRYGVRLPIGKMDVVENFPHQALRDYYEKWYRPDLQGIIVVGDIDVDYIEAKIKELFGNIKMPANPAPRLDLAVEDNAKPIYAIDSDKEQTTALIMAMRKLEAPSREFKANTLYYLSDLIENSVATMLNNRLTEASRKPECPYVFAGVDFGDFLVSPTKRAFSVIVSPKPGQEKAALQAVQEEVLRVQKFGFKPGEFARYKSERNTAMENSYNNRNRRYNDTYAREYVKHFTQGEPIMSVEQRYGLYTQFMPMIPLEAINQTVQTAFEQTDSNLVVLAMYPENEGVAIPTQTDLENAFADAAKAQLTDYVDNVKTDPFIAQIPAPKKIKKEEATKFGYTLWTLPNGARVFYRKTDFTEGRLAFYAMSQGGLSRVADKDVTSYILYDGVMEGNGIGDFTAEEYTKRIAGIDAEVASNIGSLYETLNGSAAKKDLRTLFELINLQFGPVKDDPQAFEQWRTSTAVMLENINKNPTKAFGDSLRKVMYGDNPRHAQLTPELLAQADYAAIKRLHKERFNSAGDFDFVFTGDFDVDSLRHFTETYIATLPGVKKRETYTDPKLSKFVGQRHVDFQREMESPQGILMHFRFAKADYTQPNEVAAAALGDILSFRYLESIREKHGYVYSIGASGGVSKAYDESRFALQVQAPGVTPSKADSALAIINAEVENIAQQGVTAEELAKVKEHWLKSFADDQKTNSYWASTLVEYIRYNKDDYTNYEALVKQLTSADVQRVAQALLRDNHKATVIMRPADK